MNEIRQMLIEDNIDKKKAALGAKHKVSHRAGTKCTTPSDALTPAQRKKLNGPVIKLDCNKPVSYKELKTYPEEMQKEYLEFVAENYQPTWKQWSTMLDAAMATVGRLTKKFDIHVRGRGGFSSAEAKRHQAEKWEAFMNSGDSRKAPEVQKDNDDILLSTGFKDSYEPAFAFECDPNPATEKEEIINRPNEATFSFSTDDISKLVCEPSIARLFANTECTVTIKVVNNERRY